MATKIVTKNSSTASAVPTASDLVQGELAVNVADKRLFTEDNGGAIVELGTNPSSLTVTGEITANGGIALGDNDKATFGAGDDLEIYHDGTDSFLIDNGTGRLNIRSSSDFLIANTANNQNYLYAVESGAVTLFHSGSTKLATTSTGIDVTGNMIADGVGIGTSSPSRLAHLYGTSNPALRLDNGTNSVDIGIATSNGALLNGSSTNDLVIARNGAYNIKFGTNGNTRATIDSSGNVLVGTTSVGYAGVDLTVGDTTDSQNGLAIQTSTTGYGYLLFGDGSGAAAYRGQINYKHGDDYMAFSTANTEAMRIDSSGNLLVGKTATAFGTAGIEASASSGLWSTRSGLPALALNRLSTDGSIADFYKDGTTVGSWMSRAGLVSTIILDPRSGGMGLSGSGSRFTPTNEAGVESDARNDIGTSTYRFKDLYLSGGVYLGGTGAANKLDDYEEGTWTPAVVQGSVTTSSANYTKTGRTVVLSCVLSNFTNDTSTAAVTITGLPFASKSTSVAVGSLLIRGTNRTGVLTISPFISSSSSQMTFYLSYENSTSYAPLQHDHFTSATADIITEITYITT